MISARSLHDLGALQAGDRLELAFDGGWYEVTYVKKAPKLHHVKYTGETGEKIHRVKPEKLRPAP